MVILSEARKACLRKFLNSLQVSQPQSSLTALNRHETHSHPIVGGLRQADAFDQDPVSILEAAILQINPRLQLNNAATRATSSSVTLCNSLQNVRVSRGKVVLHPGEIGGGVEALA